MSSDWSEKIAIFLVYLSLFLVVGLFCRAFTSSSWTLMSGDPIYVGYSAGEEESDPDEDDYWACPRCQALVTAQISWCANCNFTR